MCSSWHYLIGVVYLGGRESDRTLACGSTELRIYNLNSF